jgi:hypothetical protein
MYNLTVIKKLHIMNYVFSLRGTVSFPRNGNVEARHAASIQWDIRVYKTNQHLNWHGSLLLSCNQYRLPITSQSRIFHISVKWSARRF